MAVNNLNIQEDRQMIIRPFRGKSPKAAATALGADNIALIGDVTLGEHVTVWYGCTLRGDILPITIGDGTDLQDGCTVHVGVNEPTVVGRRVVVGHNALLHGCVVEDGCLIGMGAILLSGCHIGAGSIVAAGALVTEGAAIPPRSLVMGVPGRVVRSITDQEAAEILRDADSYAMEWGPEQLQPILAVR